MFARFCEWLKSIFATKAQARERLSVSAEGQKLLRYPLALAKGRSFKTAGTYPKGYPQGAVVHFTAGADAESSYSWLASQSYPCFMITRSGEVWQDVPLDRWGSHAGSSYWPGLGTNVSRFLVGIEMDCAGKLTPDGDRFKAWFGRVFGKADTRTGPTTEDREGGTYHRFTDMQEDALVKLLVWLKQNNPEVFDVDLILGHDEVSGMKGLGYWRKNDPGYALSMSMPELREKIKKLTEP